MRISLRELMIVVAVAAVGLAGLKYASTTSMHIAVQALSGALLLAFLVRAAVDRGHGQAFAIGFVFCALAYLIASVVSATTVSLATGNFGTSAVLSWLYPMIETPAWYNEATGQLAANFQVKDPLEVDNGRATRVELKDWSPEKSARVDEKDATNSPGETSAVSQEIEETSDVSGAQGEVPGFGRRRGAQAGTNAGGARGRSGRGRGRVAIVPPQELTPQQLQEYTAADDDRKIEIWNIVRAPEGQAAVLSGRPLSAIDFVTYLRRTRPTYDDFQRVGTCLWMLLVGYAGGLYARFVYARRTRPEPS
jgi:hypothetical protein